MTIDKNDFLNSILSSISRIDYVKLEDIPNIQLYMDSGNDVYGNSTFLI